MLKIAQSVKNSEIYPMIKDLKIVGFKTLLSMVCEDISNQDKVSFSILYTLLNPETMEIHSVETIVCKEIMSIATIYKSANYDEREIYDMFGIKFTNHPNLKRLLMPDSFIGHPMRKDFTQNDARLKWNAR